MSIIQDLFHVPRLSWSWDENSPFKCPSCNRKIKYKYNDGGRWITFLDGARVVVTNFYTCTWNGCVNHNGFSLEPILALPGRQYGLDVWAKAIRWHFEHKKSYRDVSKILLEENHLKVNPSTIRDMCNFFEITGADVADKKTLDMVKRNGKIILSLDGAGDNDGGPGLWIFSDRVTGHVLFADVLEHASIEALGECIKRIQQKYDVPILYVISDRQEIIVRAIGKYLPGIPHQFCHFHFLQNIARPVISKDSDLLTKLKKKSVK